MRVNGTEKKTSDKTASSGYEKLLRKIVDLPTIPQVLMRIWMILESPDSSMSDLEKVVSLDQALTAKVIRLANSPFYRTGYEASNVKNAIVNIGLEAVKNLVIAVSVTSVFKKQKRAVKFFPLKEFWCHCVAVGVAARRFASNMDGLNHETCFCAGILHDIGKFAQYILYPEEFAEALGIAAREKIHIREAEDRIFPVDHSVFGELVADHWNFTPMLKKLIGDHHKRLDTLDDEFLIETAVVKLADTTARNLSFGFPGDFTQPPLDEQVAELFGLTPETFDDFCKESLKDIQSAGEFIGLL